mmetsp:Transcript_54403/g.132960  ORF Transcript_54403/g.132960 Transcript_54403/m.132960 type:complete len:397 (-) Transcript_54403:292-1482(-)
MSHHAQVPQAMGRYPVGQLLAPYEQYPQLLSGQAGNYMQMNLAYQYMHMMALQNAQSGLAAALAARQHAGDASDKENRPNYNYLCPSPAGPSKSKQALAEQVAKAKVAHELREQEQREQVRREKEERDKARLEEQARKIREQEIQAEQRAKARESKDSVPDHVRAAVERMVEMRRNDPYRSAADAKAEFFLTPDDLAQLPCKILAAWGCGRRKLYRVEHLEEMAVLKHGEEGFKRKLQAREKKKSDKQAKEEEARKKAEELKQAARALGAPSAIAPSDTQSALSTKKWLKTAVRGKLGFDPKNDGPASFRIEVPNITAGTYAILIGKSWDSKLATLVKSGAWYSETVDRKLLFGSADISKHSRGVHLVLDDMLRLKYMPSQSLLCVHGCADFRHSW